MSESVRAMNNLVFDLYQLRTFRAVAISGNFTRAAAELGYSQPTVTHQIKALERKLGASLLERTRFSKKAVLTDAGRCVFAYSERLLALAEETIAAVRLSTSRQNHS
jgi:DNA-binding transcriptional LysR family regulator